MLTELKLILVAVVVKAKCSWDKEPIIKNELAQIWKQYQQIQQNNEIIYLGSCCFLKNGFQLTQKKSESGQQICALKASFNSKEFY